MQRLLLAPCLHPSIPLLSRLSHRDEGDIEGVVDVLRGGIVVHRLADVEHKIGCRRRRSHQAPHDAAQSQCTATARIGHQFEPYLTAG